MTTAPFVIDPALTAIAIAYRNAKLIADAVLPRVQAVPKKEYGWNQYATGTLYTVPNTAVGRRGKPQEVSFESTRQTSTVKDYGLDDPIPNDDITQALAQGLPNPKDRSVAFLKDLIDLDREVRVAGLVHNLNTYAADKRVTLSGTSQFNDQANSDPIQVIEDGLNATLGFRPNIAVMGRLAWSTVRRHPKIVKAANKTSGDTGLVSREAFAEIFELDEVLVGDAYVNTAKPGQTPTLGRAWGKHIALLYRNPLADTERGVTFGMTVPFGTALAGSRADADIGLRGGERVRVGESVDEVICAKDTGYFIQNAIA